MSKGWPYRKAKHDDEAGGSCSGKKPRNKRYVPIDYARRLWWQNRPVPWPDASLPEGGWYLNSRRVPIPPVPQSGPERRREIERGRFILPPDLRADPAFAPNSRNWLSFGTWEFHPRRQAGYLDDVDFFNAEVGVGEEEEETDDDEAEYEDLVSKEGDEFEEEDAAEEEDETQAKGDEHVDVPAWDPETQPPDISEEEPTASLTSSACGTASRCSYGSRR